MHRYRGEISRYRRPFWLPASNYYILAAAITIAFFFLVWGLLNDGREETPWIPAGIGAGVVLAGAVILREIILREARNRFIATQRQIDQSVRGVRRRASDREHPKLTLERNAAILHEISKKSDAAKVLGRFADGHREVFELCSEYMLAVERELPQVGAGSPRIAALRRGSEVATRHHHYHLLQWAEIESRTLTQEASTREKLTDKIESAQAALGVLEFALKSYPNELALLDSQRLLRELVSSMKASDLIERAEKAAFKGSHRKALSLYEDALFLLQRSEEGRLGEAAMQVDEEIAKLKGLLTEK